MSSTPTPEAIRSYALERILGAPIIQEPFPHILIDGLIPSDVYQTLVNRIPSGEAFERAVYPGTGFDQLTTGGAEHGLALHDTQAIPELAVLQDFFRSTVFRTALLERFSQPGSQGPDGTAIPRQKFKHFSNGRSDVSTVFALHKDLPGYSISPHRDVDEKIVTFLYYMEKDHLLADWGTLMCAPAEGQTLKSVEDAGGYLGHPKWRDWKLFDVVKVARAEPNTFFAFAPNMASYHAVRMDIPADHPRRERTVLRGFIRAGASKPNWIEPADNPPPGLREQSDPKPTGPRSITPWLKLQPAIRGIKRRASAIQEFLRQRGLLSQTLDAAVISYGGAGTTMLIDFLQKHLRVNHRISHRDGIKHINGPQHPALRRCHIERAVYLYADPREAVVSLFGRDYDRGMAVKLNAQHRSPHEYRVIHQARSTEPADIEAFVQGGVDVFDLYGHWRRWTTAKVMFPVLFVSYDSLHESLPDLLSFLGLPAELKKAFPPRVERVSRLEALDTTLREGLDAIYGELVSEIESRPPVFLRNP